MAAFDSQTGILVVGHGSREPDGNQPLLDLCRTMEARLEITPVQPCYLELARPTIEQGLASLHRRGVVRVIVVPLQLTAGRHVRYDIPGEVGRCLAELSNMPVCFTKHLGAHPRLAKIADSRLEEALASSGGSAAHTEYLLVARGSRDPLVRGEVLHWAGNRTFATCFIAMSEPNFEDGLRNAVSTAPDRIVVQPHLLYPGRLLQQIHGRVGEMAEQFPHIEWVSAEALGPDARLAECALDLACDVVDPDFRQVLV